MGERRDQRSNLKYQKLEKLESNEFGLVSYEWVKDLLIYVKKGGKHVIDGDVVIGED